MIGRLISLIFKELIRELIIDPLEVMVVARLKTKSLMRRTLGGFALIKRNFRLEIIRCSDLQLLSIL
jgi:hypothetical protein